MSTPRVLETQARGDLDLGESEAAPIVGLHLSGRQTSASSPSGSEKHFGADTVSD